VELADSAVRFDDILGLRPDVLLCRTTFSGSDRAGGGAWEVQNVELLVFGVDGRVTRLEVIDADHDAEALARFDELTAEPAATAPIENAATRCVVLVIAAWEARDWERVAARHAPPFRMMDHRKLMRWELDRSAQLETLRVLFEMPSSRLTSQPLATRGDRLALHRWRVEASGDAFGHDFGPSAFEFLQVIEVDDHGDAVTVVAFDPDDLDAAYAELDARHAAGGAGADARSSDSAQRPPAAKP
jgi:hypothetical protein